MKYHINPETGNANQCVAKPGNCRFGSDTAHYETKQEAREAFEKSMVSEDATAGKTKAALAEEERVKFAFETDSKLAEKSQELAQEDRRAFRTIESLGRRVKIKLESHADVERILEAADAFRDNRHSDLSESVRFARYQLQVVKDLQEEVNELNKQYKGWNRYFLVPGGHIHSSMNCHTCNRNWNNPTQFAWLPQLSGKTDANAVKEQGALLCTACFPDAPTEWTNQKELEAEAKRSTECEGSRSYDYDPKTARRGFYSGNYGVCKHCGQRVTLTKADKLRGHKPKS